MHGEVSSEPRHQHAVQVDLDDPMMTSPEDVVPFGVVDDAEWMDETL